MPAACGVEMRKALTRAAVAAAVALAVLVVLVCTVTWLPPVHIRVPQGLNFSIDLGPRWAGQPSADPPDSLLFGEVSGGSVSITPTRTGRTQVQLRLFNRITWRNYIVDVVPQMTVMPGGHSIGVRWPRGAGDGRLRGGGC